MLEKTKLNLLVNSKIAVWCVTVMLLFVGFTLVLQGFIDTHDYRNQIVKTIHDQTGRDVTIKGNVSVSLLPTPTIYIPGVELRGPENNRPGPVVMVDLVRLDISVLTILSKHPRIKSVTLQHPVLELVRAEDNFIHWDWLNSSLLKLMVDKHGTESLAANITNGQIVYRDTRNETAITLEDVQAYTTVGTHFAVKGSFVSGEHTLKFNVDSKPGATPVAAGALPFNVKLYTDSKNALELQEGSLDVSGDLPKIKGKFTCDIEDMLDWVGTETPQERQQKFDPLAHFIKGGAKITRQELPLKISASWEQEGLNIDMTGVDLQGMDSSGKGSISLNWKGWQPDFISQMAFTKVNFDQWRTVLTDAFAETTVDTDNTYHRSQKDAKNPLPGNLQMTLNLTADQVQVGPQIWNKAKMAIDLADATVTVNQFNIELPGDASLTLFGIISQGGTGGLRFEGSMETAGKSLRHLLTVFDETAAELPETGFGSFYAHSNIFVSAEQMRLSEADIKISDLRLNGGLVAYYDAKPRLEADIRLKDINFDYFRDVWRDKQQLAGHQDFFLQFDKGSSFNWLKKLQTTIDLKVNVDGFTFLERKGDTASFRLFAQQGEFGIYDVRFNFPEGTTAGGFKLDVKAEQAKVDVTFNTDTLNTDYFSYKPPAEDTDIPVEPDTVPSFNTQEIAETIPTFNTPQIARAPVYSPTMSGFTEESENAKKRWSAELFDMSWMEGFNGTFDISIGKLIHKDMQIDRLKLQATLDHNMLTFKNFNFLYWQGRCSVLGAMYGGKVPGISISFTLYNAELQDLLHAIAGRDNITGKVSVNGSLTTSGVNPISWVEQSDAKLIMVGNVHVNGVNIQGVIDAVKNSRTAADVFNNVNLKLVNGATDFDIGGTINMKNGVMQTPGISLKTWMIGGNFRGEIKLVPWTMDTTTLFQFPSLVSSSETVPTMTVQLTGPLDDPQLRTDTASLEAHVVGKMTGK